MTGQKDLIDVGRSVFKIEPRDSLVYPRKRIYFSFLPTTYAAQNTGRSFITATTAGFYLGDPKTTFISTLTFAPYWNFKARYGLPLRSNIWLKNNIMTIQGDIRLLVYPQYTYGLNSKTPPTERVLLNSQYIRFYQSILYKIEPAGMGYNLDSHLDIETNRGIYII